VNATCLIVDDEPDLRELVRYNLESGGFEVIEAADGETALALARSAQPEAIVLDVMLPGLDGLEILRRLRGNPQTRDIPIILLTAKGEESDRIVGLELGADDYVVKPFSPRELVTRVKTVMRRFQRAADKISRVTAGPITVDASRRVVSVSGKDVLLTTTEFNLLHFMMERLGQALTRNELIEGAIGRDAMVTDRTIDAHVAAVRRKLGTEGAKWVETIRGYGYRLRET
jgi:DNA-binding response OmpR family regulator